MCIRDSISAIDGEDITEDEVSDVADIVRNSDKDSVVLTVHREGEEDAMEITVPVTDVELPSVFHEMLDSKIGYIRITQSVSYTHLDVYKRQEYKYRKNCTGSSDEHYSDRYCGNGCNHLACSGYPG